MALSSAVRMTGIAKAEAIRLALGLGVLGVTVTGLSTVATGAFFTSTNHVAPKIVAGTVNLSTTPTSAALNITGMAPGDIQYGTITVKNTGSLASRYSVSTTVSSAQYNLVEVLKLAAAVSSDGKCGAATFATPGATLVDDVSPAALAIGSSRQGADPGDRPLDSMQSETLCFRATLPGNATNDNYQGKAASMTFVFNSEQTANNP